MPKLVLLRHGQSQWNLENRFTGWWDSDLSDKGIAEARTAGKLLKDRGFDFDLCFTSVQTRAIRTLAPRPARNGPLWLPATKDWHLNERHYGGLTGLNKQEMIDKVGAEQVKIWRRSFDTRRRLARGQPLFRRQRPPLCGRRRAGERKPQGYDRRVLPYYEREIAPRLSAASGCIVAAHGNSLRALEKHLSKIERRRDRWAEIPTGEPIVYELGPTWRSNGVII
jgi:2,3-bisphosphoglycerate-dependent phosphoglycerate mutase